MRNSLVGLENGYPSAYEVGTCYKVLFFFLSSIEKNFLRALARNSSESGPRYEILGDQIRNFNF